MDLQRTAEAVTALGEAHKESVSLLQNLASAVTSQCTSIKSANTALEKQKILEKKAAEKEVERQRKVAKGWAWAAAIG